MAGVYNKSSKLFYLTNLNKENGAVTKVRLVPNKLNHVKDSTWEVFVPKKGEVDPYVANLERAGQIAYGSHVEDRLLDDGEVYVESSNITKVLEEFKEPKKSRRRTSSKSDSPDTES